MPGGLKYTIAVSAPSKVLGIPDINADGYGDLLIVSEQMEYLGAYSGKDGAFLAQAPGILNPNDSLLFGVSLSTVGDLNNDSFAEILVGAPAMAPNPLNKQGKVHVFSGRPSPGDTVLPPITSWTPFQLTQTGTNPMQYGFSVAGVGDLNGNGRPDVIVGAPEWAGGGFLRVGAIEAVELTPGTGMPTQLHIAFNGSGFGGGTRFGYSVAAIGDATGDLVDACDDGLPDFAVGMPRISGSGMIRVFRGRRDQTTPGCTISPPFIAVGYAQADIPAPNDFFGYSIVGLGNATGDAFDDFAVGAPWANRAAYVFRGGDPLILAPCFTIGSGTCREFGTALSGITDRNADGLRDLLVGAPRNQLAGPCVDCATGEVWSLQGGCGASGVKLSEIPEETGCGGLQSTFGTSVSTLRTPAGRSWIAVVDTDMDAVYVYN